MGGGLWTLPSEGTGFYVDAKMLAQTREVCYVCLNIPATPLPSGMRNPGGFFIALERHA